MDGRSLLITECSMIFRWTTCSRSARSALLLVGSTSKSVNRPIRISSYSDRTASEARRVRSSIVAGLIPNPYCRLNYRVIAEYAFFGAVEIGCNDLSLIFSQLGFELPYACLKQLILTFELLDDLVFVHPPLDRVLLS